MLLFLVTPCLVLAVQPCMEWIPIKKKRLSSKVESHKDFLSHYIAEKNNSKGFKTWIKKLSWKLWSEIWRRIVSQTEWFFTHANERHDNLLWKEHRIHRLEHQQYWNNFEKFNRKPGISKHWQILKTNVESTKRRLQQQKFKKFNYLKYKT